MKEHVKIVRIGAGSKEFSRGLIHDLVLDKELPQATQIESVLVDIHAQSLQTMLAYVERCVETTNASITFRATTDRGEALPNYEPYL